LVCTQTSKDRSGRAPSSLLTDQRFYQKVLGCPTWAGCNEQVHLTVPKSPSPIIFQHRHKLKQSKSNNLANTGNGPSVDRSISGNLLHLYQQEGRSRKHQRRCPNEGSSKCQGW